MKSFKSTLDEISLDDMSLDEAKLQDALLNIDSNNYQDLKDAYYHAVEGIAKAKEILSKIGLRGNRVTPFTKEVKIFQNLYKNIDKSDLGKFL
jgi:hypothetical protein